MQDNGQHGQAGHGLVVHQGQARGAAPPNGLRFIVICPSEIFLRKNICTPLSGGVRFQRSLGSEKKALA